MCGRGFGLKYDAVIAGAGVAGSALAYFLALKGFNVVAFDRANVYRKACGDAITLRPGISKLVKEVDGVKGEVRRYTVIVDGLEAAYVEYPERNWVIVDKTKFVSGLRNLALSEGAVISKGEWRGLKGSLLTVDARGPYSQNHSKSVLVFRLIAKAKWDWDHALLDFRVKERGFYWIFPADYDGHIVNIGGGFEEVVNGVELRKLVYGYARKMLGSYEVLDARGAPISIRAPISLYREGVFRVGEAAGLVISTAGEGNRPALQSAYGLAEAVGRGLDVFRTVKLYRRYIKDLIDEAKTSRILLSIMSRSSPERGRELLINLPKWFWIDYLRSSVTMPKLVKLSLLNGYLFKIVRALLSSQS